MRTIFAVGLVGFLSIDVFQDVGPVRVAVIATAAYAMANVAAWTAARQHARWWYIAIDVTYILFVRHIFLLEMLVDPNATMVGAFTLALLTYTIYGDPRITMTLSAAAVAATIATLAADALLARAPAQEVVVYVLEPLRVVLLLGYLAAICALTIGLSRRLRSHVVNYGIELLKRLQATMATSVERNRREKIEELNRLKRDFISVLSHELRTPLTPLRSSLDLLLCGTDVGETELLQIARDSTEKLQRLVLDYTQLAELLTEQESDVDRWNVELSEFMDVLRGEEYFRRVATAGLEGLCVSVDPRLLAAAILALLRRAELVSARSVISLCGFSHTTGVTLSVHDSDSFIDRDMAHILDDPFGLSSERTFVSANTGLELILARYALQRTGGTLRVTSSERRGTTAFCLLPGAHPGLQRLDRSQIEYELESVLLYSVR